MQAEILGQHGEKFVGSGDHSFLDAAIGMADGECAVEQRVPAVSEGARRAQIVGDAPGVVKSAEWMAA